jgi:thiamine-monophosphate kinase
MMLENTFIQQFTKTFSRSPHQINGLHESDAELLQHESLGGEVLAITVDGLADEIQAGLYDDPYIIGWTAVNASLSDLAAVGASPLGILLQLQLPPDMSAAELQALSAGVREACDHHRTYLLGGDTNRGRQLDVSVTALGRCRRPMLRKGCQPGDWLFCSGPMGYGSAYAFAKIFLQQQLAYRPLARLDAGLLIADYASSCIDSSDGLFPALAQLCETNPWGFVIETPLQDLLEPTAAALAAAHDIADWMLLAGPHGEYELVFTIPDTRLHDFRQAAALARLPLLQLGRCEAAPLLHFTTAGRPVSLPAADIANLYEQQGSNPQAYFRHLQQLDQSWQP